MSTTQCQLAIRKYVVRSVNDDHTYSQATKDDNPVVKHWKPEWAKIEKRDCLSHHEVLQRIDGYDQARGTKVAGHRGYCLTGYGVFLNLALINYGLEFLWEKGYTPNQPPQFMLRRYMAKTAQLEQFDEELYKVTDDGAEETDKYLIATSEQPLSALHDSEWLLDHDLPIRCVQKASGGALNLNISQVCWVQYLLSQGSGRSWQGCLGYLSCPSI